MFKQWVPLNKLLDLCYNTDSPTHPLSMHNTSGQRTLRLLRLTHPKYADHQPKTVSNSQSLLYQDVKVRMTLQLAPNRCRQLNGSVLAVCYGVLDTFALVYRFKHPPVHPPRPSLFAAH